MRIPVIIFLVITCLASCNETNPKTPAAGKGQTTKKDSARQKPAVAFDSTGYLSRIAALANGDSSGLWPVKDKFTLPGAILPYKRIVAFYGNLYSKQMGILGELPEKEMLEKLQAEVKKWTAADSTTPAIPALHYIAVTAQQSPGPVGKYGLRIPFSQL